MPQALEAVFDGTALQLEEPLNLAAGTRVTIIIESVLPNEVKPPNTKSCFKKMITISHKLANDS